MAQGQIVAEGPPLSVMADPKVIDAYLGSHHDQDLSDVEEQILAEAQAEIEAERQEEEAGAEAPAAEEDNRG
jgi:branched-chain amino acid transport system ATP-binding protein